MSEDFYLVKGNNGEDCKVVLETYANKISGQAVNGSTPWLNDSIVQRSNLPDEHSREETNEVWSLSQNDYKLCEMRDCGDLCDGCSIRFYHNSIDQDEFFAHSQVSKTKGGITIY